jgi:hypothetical protein
LWVTAISVQPATTQCVIGDHAVHAGGHAGDGHAVAYKAGGAGVQARCGANGSDHIAS